MSDAVLVEITKFPAGESAVGMRVGSASDRFKRVEVQAATSMVFPPSDARVRPETANPGREREARSSSSPCGEGKRLS